MTAGLAGPHAGGVLIALRPRPPGRRVLLLDPGQLGLQVAYLPPEPAQVRQQAQIRAAEVAE
jgi:hypothetical protein